MFFLKHVSNAVGLFSLHVAVCVSAGAVAGSEPAELLERCKVVWETPSQDQHGSMPAGNGDIGLNVWADHEGVAFYLSKTDAWSENVRLLKLGRVRIRLDPNPFIEGAAFRQTLELADGQIVIQAGQADRAAKLAMRVDANHPVVCVDVACDEPTQLAVELEVWRTDRRMLEAPELFSAYGLHGDNPDPVVVEPDVVVPDDDDRIVWYHRNERSAWAANLARQGLGDLARTLRDPLLHRTFGAAIEGSELVRDGAKRLVSKRARRHHEVRVHALTSQAESVGDWLAELDAQIRSVQAVPSARRKIEHERWWRRFWQRSWIRVSGSPEAEKVTRGYTLQRYISACAGRGGSPIKFNGSIFTVGAVVEGRALDADYRKWGGPYWWQNTRLAYWPMLAAGDLDMMKPLFEMYLQALPLARKRTQVYYGHDGAFFPETIYFWGTYVDNNYGWNRGDLPMPVTTNRYIRYLWQGGLELVAMMLDWCSYSGDRAYLLDRVVPFADAIVTFYDQHYPRNDAGRLRIEPAQALETYWDVPNPLPPIAGLRHVLRRLLALDLAESAIAHARTGIAPNVQTADPRTVRAMRQRWRRLLAELPPLPKRKVDSQKILAPAEVIDNKRNSENPELYAIWPYELVGVGRGRLELGRRTFAHRVHKKTGGWSQDAIQAACLGLVDLAARDVVHNFSTFHEGSRFPAFWGPNYDWIPDQDHGGVASIALQKMLLQSAGSEAGSAKGDAGQGDEARGGRSTILLLPAWPADWDVDFKLRAPEQTSVRCIYRDGVVHVLKVLPDERTDVRLVAPEISVKIEQVPDSAPAG